MGIQNQSKALVAINLNVLRFRIDQNLLHQLLGGPKLDEK